MCARLRVVQSLHFEAERKKYQFFTAAHVKTSAVELDE